MFKQLIKMILQTNLNTRAQHDVIIPISDSLFGVVYNRTLEVYPSAYLFIVDFVLGVSCILAALNLSIRMQDRIDTPAGQAAAR